MTGATPEVVNAVQQILENEGVLQAIRAQLRASVLSALNTKDSERRSSFANEFLEREIGRGPWHIEVLSQLLIFTIRIHSLSMCYLFLSGRGSVLCVFDLLKKLNLRQTLSILEAEIGKV
jgi:hypothetical protein